MRGGLVIEALGAGTPVIARHNRGSAELLVDGVGVLLTTGDADAWADSVQRVVESPPDAAAIWSRALGYGVDRFRAHEELVSEMEADARVARCGSS